MAEEVANSNSIMLLKVLTAVLTRTKTVPVRAMLLSAQ